MKVQCFLCSYEQSGFCTKKKKGGKPAKVELKKKRSCTLYAVDADKRAIENIRKQEAATIPRMVPTFRYYLTKKQRKEMGVENGPLFVKKV